MKRYSSIVLFAGGFFLGVLLASLIGGIEIRRIYASGQADATVIQVRNRMQANAKLGQAVSLYEKAVWADKIRSGHMDEYFRYIDGSFKHDVPQIYSYCRDTRFGKLALWSVQDYYSKNNLPIPAELKDILQSVPPRTSSGKDSDPGAQGDNR